jgi:hypothetical protein
MLRLKPMIMKPTRKTIVDLDNAIYLTSLLNSGYPIEIELPIDPEEILEDGEEEWDDY